MPAGTGDVFLLSGCTHGSFQQLPAFERQKVLLMGGGFGRIYMVCEQIVNPDMMPPSRVFVFEDYTPFPTDAIAFGNLTEDLREIAAGKEHLLALTSNGQVYSCGRCEYGSVGVGGKRDVSELQPVPALRGKRVRHIAACGYSSLAVTFDGDAYAWGSGFQAETGLPQMPVASVPRFVPSLSKLRILQVACGNAHCLARTEMQTCAVWGDNSCGQLGIGTRSIPVTEPQILPMIENVRLVSAGWAHSAALLVTPDTHAYTWGLNSHGQLGLGDTKTRRQPELIQHFVKNSLVVETVACNRASCVFTTPNQAWLSGRFPILPAGVTVAVPEVLPGVPSRLELGSTDLPRRTTEVDPAGCALTPLALEFHKQLDPEAPPGEGPEAKVAVRNLVASDLHVLAFVPSAVIKVNPALSPLEGGTHIQIFATGLACDEPSAFGTLSIDDTLAGEGAMDPDPMERLKVRLVCQKPECDVVVKARCVGKNRLVISSPDLSLSPIAPRAHNGPVHLTVQVSMDGGLSWTEDSGVTLTYLEYPLMTTGLDPECAPLQGGTKLSIHTPGLKFPGIPTDNLCVAFRCRPKARPPANEKPSPLEDDIAGAYVNMSRTNTGWFADKGGAEYPPVGDLNIYAYGTYDYRKEIIEVLSPPFDAETFHYYDVYVDASLDGKRYCGTPLKFTVYDLKILGLSPNCGPLHSTTVVTPVTEGLVKSQNHWCRADFPEDVEARRDLPGKYNNTKSEITITMPSLKQEVQRRVEYETGNLPEPVERFPEDGEDDLMAQEIPPPDVDPDGGLNGLRVPVELTLNGQNYTEDQIEFTYYGHLELAPPILPEGMTPEEPAPIDTEILCSIQNLPENLDVAGAMVRFKVISPTAEDPANPKDEDFVVRENVPANLHYRGMDAVLVTAVPPILATRIEGNPEKVTAMLELSLNRQHFMSVPGVLNMATRPPEPDATEPAP